MRCKSKKAINKYILLIVITIIITLILIGAGAKVFWELYKRDDSGRKAIAYVEQGIVLAIALISICTSIVTMICGREKEMSQRKREDDLRSRQEEREERLTRQQNEFEEKWMKQKIDADLKAKARIDWIQKVREATTSFVSSIYSMANIVDRDDKNTLRQKCETINEKGALLKLYFGPDKEKVNEEIVSNINSLVDKSNKVFEEITKKNTITKIKEKEAELSKIIVPQIPRTVILEDGEKVEIEDDDESSKEFLEKVELCNYIYYLQSEYALLYEELKMDVSEFAETIRKYLKVEWDRAKDNKD